MTLVRWDYTTWCLLGKDPKYLRLVKPYKRCPKPYKIDTGNGISVTYEIISCSEDEFHIFVDYRTVFELDSGALVLGADFKTCLNKDTGKNCTFRLAIEQ